jgi:membrane fusion protein, heavy metal efflux system
MKRGQAPRGLSMRFSALPRHVAVRFELGAIAISAAAALVFVPGVPALLGFGAAHVARADEGSGKAATPSAEDANTVELTDTQLRSVKVAPVEAQVFPVQDDAIGNIDFNEDMSAQVFTPYQGRILQLFAKVGDDVVRGQLLFTIDSPDLLQAESTLIQSAGVLKLTTRALDRTKALLAAKGAAQKDLDQAVSDQQSAEGNFKAARDSVRIFGKTPADIDAIVAARRVDSKLEVHSPITGKVTTRAAAPGLFVQPGNVPAPFTVADINTMWMLANVPEDTIARYKVGQAVRVTVPAWPDRVFTGRITTIGSSVDPTTRRTFLRSEIDDPEYCLRSGMFANFVIQTGDPVSSLAVPADGVVREGDGMMTVWVTTDRKKFVKRTVTLGQEHAGTYQVVDGLHQGELIAATGALFLSNTLNGVSSD